MDDEKSKVIDEDSLEDVVNGFMTEPEEISEWDVPNSTLICRLAIDAWRKHCGWQHRIVDHTTERWLKSLTWAQHQCLNESHIRILHMLKMLTAHDVKPVMGKRDVTKAFRCNTINPART